MESSGVVMENLASNCSRLCCWNKCSGDAKQLRVIRADDTLFSVASLQQVLNQLWSSKISSQIYGLAATSCMLMRSLGDVFVQQSPMLITDCRICASLSLTAIGVSIRRSSPCSSCGSTICNTLSVFIPSLNMLSVGLLWMNISRRTTPKL